jgi:hypothetical protein
MILNNKQTFVFWAYTPNLYLLIGMRKSDLNWIETLIIVSVYLIFCQSHSEILMENFPSGFGLFLQHVFSVHHCCALIDTMFHEDRSFRVVDQINGPMSVIQLLKGEVDAILRVWPHAHGRGLNDQRVMGD